MNTEYATLELRVHRQVQMPDNASIQDLCREHGMNAAAQESFWIITYDSGRNLRRVTEVSRGSYRDVMVSIPAVMAAIHKSGADRFIAVHNHPSGDPSPTNMDLDLTKKIMNAANTDGLYFEDHIIVSPDGSYESMAEIGMLIPDPSLSAHAREGAIKARKPRMTRYVLNCETS